MKTHQSIKKLLCFWCACCTVSGVSLPAAAGSTPSIALSKPVVVAAVAQPSEVLGGLQNWKLQLPVDISGNGKSGEIKQPQLDGYSDAYFKVNANGDGVLFTTPINGLRTSNNTRYARTELREIYRGANAVSKDYWPCGSTHSMAHEMHLEQIVHQSSTNKPQIGIGQIHDATNDNLLIKYVGPSGASGTGDTGAIKVAWNNNSASDTLDGAYRMGDLMVLDIAISADSIMTVTYKNLRTGARASKSARLSDVSGEGCYFKAGNYIQDCVDSAYAYTNVMGQETVQPTCRSRTPPSNAQQRSIVEIKKLVLR